jgi:hypothetical protein
VNVTREHKLFNLAGHIERGATFVGFLNTVSENLATQIAAYEWIPFITAISRTNDRIVVANSFDTYPDSDWKVLAPIVRTELLDLPVRNKIKMPPHEIGTGVNAFSLFGNGQYDALGIVIVRGRGRVLLLPRYKSNDDVIETFLNRVMPKLYDLKARTTLIDTFKSPSEKNQEEGLEGLRAQIKETEQQFRAAQVELARVEREKANVINADQTAKQILIYYDQARKQDDVALFYLYKVIEVIENKFGGEASGIKAVGAGAEWKRLKKIANVSYGDARHAPKPTDIVKPWTDSEIKACFADVEKIVMAYFTTLFVTGSATPPV